VLSGGHFALRRKRVEEQQVAANFNLRLHRLEACATKDFSPAGWGLAGKNQKKPRRLKHRGL
jgi:hypothetical protein